MTLGARPRDVMMLVVGEGAALIAAGLAVGIVSAAALSRLLSSTLYHVSPGDPVTFANVALVLSGAALAASWLPARRAARISPIVALRSE